MGPASDWRRCAWCNGWLTPSSDELACPHPGALGDAPPRPRMPPVILDAVPPPAPAPPLPVRSEPAPPPRPLIVRRVGYRRGER
jgi:hypothetical protein